MANSLGKETCYAVVPWLWGHDVDSPYPQVEVIEMSRSLGIYYLENVWESVHHLGQVPDDRGRALANLCLAKLGNERRYSAQRFVPREYDPTWGQVEDEGLVEADASVTP